MVNRTLVAVAIVVVIAIGAGVFLMQQPAPEQSMAPKPAEQPPQQEVKPPEPPKPVVPQEGLSSSLVIALNPRGDINITAANRALSSEGIAADKQGRLFLADRVTTGEVYMVDPKDPKLVTVAKVSRMEATRRDGTKSMVIPSLLGMTFDKQGNLYIASSGLPGQDPAKPLGFILRVDSSKLNPSNPGNATVWATGVPGANGIAFDKNGNLYVSTFGAGIIYMVPPTGGEAKVFAEKLGTPNGIAFDKNNVMYVASTRNASIWRIELNADGTLKSVAEHIRDPKLVGADGLQVDSAGNIWVVANARNALVAVTPDKKVIDVSKNDNNGPLEAPASLVIVGKTVYIANADFEASPAAFGGAAGEPGNRPRLPGAGPGVAKVDIGIEGAPVPP
ncbi:MAG: SMP-30/gluconolactonase/LRE family protein [Thaumarchaeota archaeon]|nr:SMP-30/gluconolactonase/LRE family protein [Nitrososphaerota archaeon]